MKLYFLLTLFVFAIFSVNFPYPIESSWFSDRYTPQEWNSVLTEFSSIGGHIIWQRGRILRIISSNDLQSHPDFQWCFINGLHCVQMAQKDAKTTLNNAKIVNFLIYDYEENYGETILSCPHDRIVFGSRVYHILYLPHDSYQTNPCDISGKNIDVLFISWAGIDSKEILFEEIQDSKLKSIDWEIYLSGPYLPVEVLNPWKVNVQLLPATYEFTKRVYNSYEKRFGHFEAFKGIYQAMETSMSSPTIDPGILEAYSFQVNLTHNFFSTQKKFVISPYVNTNRDFVLYTRVLTHANNFEKLARLGIDVIAVQEGRGCGKNALYEPFQENSVISTIDPKLAQIVHYLEKKKTIKPTYGETFFFPSRLLFEAFRKKIEELKAPNKPEFWLNVEAFEYLRDDPCFPIDKMGNGMAEILDRSTKWRIDMSLTHESFYVNKITTFAWDYDYQCTTKEYDRSIYEEIQADYSRPIVVQVECFDSSCEILRIFGFSFTQNLSQCELLFFKEDGSHLTFQPFFFDGEYGLKNNKPRTMSEYRIKNNGLLKPQTPPVHYGVFVALKNLKNEEVTQSTHPRYFYL